MSWRVKVNQMHTRIFSYPSFVCTTKVQPTTSTRLPRQKLTTLPGTGTCLRPLPVMLWTPTPLSPLEPLPLKAPSHSYVASTHKQVNISTPLKQGYLASTLSSNAKGPLALCLTRITDQFQDGIRQRLSIACHALGLPRHR